MGGDDGPRDHCQKAKNTRLLHRVDRLYQMYLIVSLYHSVAFWMFSLQMDDWNPTPPPPRPYSTSSSSSPHNPGCSLISSSSSCISSFHGFSSSPYATSSSLATYSTSVPVSATAAVAFLPTPTVASAVWLYCPSLQAHQDPWTQVPCLTCLTWHGWSSMFA